MIKLNVISIDDDEFMLKAVARLIRRLRPEWQLVVHQDAMTWQEALTNAAIDEPSIVISDLLMPHKKGSELLEEVRQKYPEAIRVLLTGDTTHELPQEAHHYAHFILPKPFTEQDFEHLFQCAERLYQMPFNHDCRKRLGQLSGLPVRSDTVAALQKVIASPSCDVHAMSDIICHEPTLAARILQMANSSFLGFRRPTDSLPDAVGRLGASLVEAIAVSLLTKMSNSRVSPSLQSQISNRALRASGIARQLTRKLHFSLAEQDKVFVACLLTSIGTLLMIEQGAPASNVNHYFELQPGYHDHHVVAAYLLVLWGYEIDIGDMILMQSHLNFSEKNQLQRFGSLIGLSRLLDKQQTEAQLVSIAEKLPVPEKEAVLGIIPSILSETEVGC